MSTTKQATAPGRVILRLDQYDYRACQLCDHGRASCGKTCTHPEAPRFNTVTELRDPGGACGPEARWLDYAGLNTQVGYPAPRRPLATA